MSTHTSIPPLRFLRAVLTVGGLMTIADGSVNFAVYGPMWKTAYTALGLYPSPIGQLLFWLSFDFFNVACMLIIYDMAHVRYGHGWRAIAATALLPWFLIHMVYDSHLLDGVFPASVLLPTASFELLTSLGGAILVARFYRARRAFRAAAPAALAPM